MKNYGSKGLSGYYVLSSFSVVIAFPPFSNILRPSCPSTYTYCVDKMWVKKNMEDDVIVWKHKNDGVYSAASAYRAQFLGLVISPLDRMIWKNWAPPKVKFFAWLALQDRIWTADRLAKRGWPNSGLCTVCRREQERSEQFFFQCRYTLRVWEMVRAWLQLIDLDTLGWAAYRSIHEWWCESASAHSAHKKVMPSIFMLVSKAI